MPDMENFLAFLKEEVLPGVWSKGVALSRNSKSIEMISRSTEETELKFKIQTTERMLAFQVTLWPKDQDSHCNCGSKIEPCHHVVAVALAIQNGILKIDAEAPKNEGARLDYRWIYDSKESTKKPKISLKRQLFVKGELQEIPSSLMNLIGGIQSGRISSPMPSATPTDLKIDEIFSKPSPAWNEVLRAVSELPPLAIEGHPSLKTLRVDPKRKMPTLTLTNHGEHSILIEPELFETGTELEGDLFLKGDLLSQRPATPHFQTKVVHPSQFEALVKDELLRLSDFFELLIETTRLPKAVAADPDLKLTLHPVGEDQISVTATIEYPTLKKNELLNRDLKKESEWIKFAREKWGLKLDQPMTLGLEAALLLRDRGIPTAALSDLDSFLGNFFQKQSGISLETALKEKETLLKLLTLREKKSAPDSRFAQLLGQLLGQRLKRPSASEKLKPLGDSTPKTVSPELWAQLRDYQKTGVQWLAEKSNSLQGAILADDMGLGKTVQTLAGLHSKALVIVPTSLLVNWKNEAARFRPDLRVQIYHGPHRAWDEAADLTLTTYSLLRLEPARFLSIDWNTVVLDEAHLIRNPETQAAIATSKLNAQFRIALTGTPIQNRKRDLYSLFQFVAPDFFDSEQDLDPKLTAPFFLRRTKQEVLTELPPKTHLEHWVQLSESERSLYDSMFAAAKKEIIERLGDSETLSPFTLFEVLLRSRQVCNHSGLVDASKRNDRSSKIDEIMALAQELMEAGHSVLIYSQWTQFLDRLETEFKGLVPYFRLDGTTQNRGAVVEQFQNSAHPTAFLLSLHAGGVGLNLMKASHVIFCDPWWNPFVELQAEDRAYRMGQEKPVTIHRILVENSIEVQIRELQSQKLKLGEEVFQAQDFKILLHASEPTLKS